MTVTGVDRRLPNGVSSMTRAPDLPAPTGDVRRGTGERDARRTRGDPGDPSRRGSSVRPLCSVSVSLSTCRRVIRPPILVTIS